MHRRLPLLLAGLLVAVPLAGCLGGPGGPAGGTLDDGSDGDGVPAVPRAVVALVDTGINPYHVEFRDDSPRAFAHPSTYLEGYPEDARALDLSLHIDDYWQAVRADCEDVWSTVEPGQLYWVPGTRIVGAISTQPAGADGPDCGAEEPTVPYVLDNGGHGTMVASRAAASTYGACNTCLVVSVHGFNTDSIEWAASNATWIDAQSNSWGPFLPLIAPNAVNDAAFGVVSDSAFVASVEETAQEHLSFWASGNGALTRFGAVGHPTPVDPRMTPSIVMVGGHDSGYVNLWPDWPPHVVSDSCNSWAAYHRETSESAEDVGGGTSGASPFAAGMATRVLLEARTLLGDTRTGVRDGNGSGSGNGSASDGLVVADGTPPAAINGTDSPIADGRLTLDEWKRLVKATATPRPERQHEDGSVCDAVEGLVLYGSTPVQWQDVPEDYPGFLHVGYGAVDNASRDLAFDVLAGAEPLPDRSRVDAYFMAEAPARQALHEAFVALP